MDENCISLFLEVICSSHSIIEGHPNQSQIQPLASMIPHTVYLQFGRNLRHKNGAFNFELVAAVGDPLCVVARARSHNSSCFFLLG